MLAGVDPGPRRRPTVGPPSLRQRWDRAAGADRPYLGIDGFTATGEKIGVRMNQVLPGR